MFGNRPDGRVVHDMPPLQKIMPYILKTRTDSMNMYEDQFDCAPMDAYIREKRAEGYDLNYMHIIIAAMVRMLALRPQLNRFIMNGKIYARKKIWISFVVHETLREDSEETTIKLCFEGTETILEIAKIINERVAKETGTKREPNATDKLVNVIMNKIPGPLIRGVVNTLMFMDRHNCLPKAIIEASPFHTSVFLTNLKSLGINHIFHHCYEFGTTGLFLAMGKEKKQPVVSGGQIVTEKRMGYGLVMDERYCDGLYFARSLRKLRRYMANPALLEEPLEARVQDAN